MRRPRPPESLHVVAAPPSVGEVLDTRLLSIQLSDEARTEAPVDVVFTEGFLSAHAGVPDLRTLLSRAGLPPSGEVDRGFLKALGPGTLDAVARDFTDFSTWADLEEAAARAYAARKLLDFTL